jgi:exopolysaccharide biosynthesis polyprenyl glycosylphosphotransferase
VGGQSEEGGALAPPTGAIAAGDAATPVDQGQVFAPPVIDTNGGAPTDAAPLTSGPATADAVVAELDADYARGGAAKPDFPAFSKYRASTLKRALMAADLLAIVAGFALAFTIQEVFRPVPASTISGHLFFAFWSLPAFMIGAGLNRMYHGRANERRSEELGNIVRTVAVGMSLLLLGAFALQYKELSRLWVISAFAGTFGMLVLERIYARRAFNRMRNRGEIRRRIVIVGTDADAIGLMHTLRRYPEHGYEVVGFVGPADGTVSVDVDILGSTDDALAVLDEHRASGVVVSLASVSSREVNQLTRRLTEARYHVALSSSLRDIDLNRLRPSNVDGHTLLYVEPIVRGGWRGVAKRVFDIVLSAAILLLTLPITIAAAIAIKLESRGPVVFRQTRVGKDGEHFEVYKLRTMVADAELRRAELAALNEADGALFKIERDPRVTRVGRILRKLSIDELPQLVCVLRGTMSMVGPRPALPDEVALWEEDVHERLRVLPGITGMWQVSGRSDTSFEQYKRLDLYYVDNWSLLHDLVICTKTVGVVMTGRGAA